MIKKTLSLNFIITAASLHHYASTKIFVKYLFLFLLICLGDRSSHHRCSIKKVFLKISQISQENTTLESLFNKVEGLKVFNFIKKETPPRLFFCEYCEIFRKNFLYGTPPVAASVNG